MTLLPVLRGVVLGLGKLAQERVGQAVTGHADARVHGDGAVRPGDHRVEVKLGDLRQVAGEPRHAEQGVAQRTDVGRGLAEVPEPAAVLCSKPGTIALITT